MYQISFHQEQNLVLLQLNGFLRSETLRSAWLEALEEIIKQDAQYFLIDAQAQKVVTKEDQEWLWKTFMPKAEAAAVQSLYRMRVARIESKDLFNQMSAKMFEQLFAQANFSFDYRNFGDLEEGKKWLFSLD